MTDATRRKLHLPNWYPPYLEKHRIYDLFHELGRELVIQEPNDHVLFLKQLLYHASVSKDAPRVILLAPLTFNVYEIAKKISEATRAVVITEQDIIGLVTKSPRRPKHRKLVKSLSELIRTENVYSLGWILPDFPKNWLEASHMVQSGILPTHVFQFIPPYSPSIRDLNVKNPASWTEYRRAILGLRDVFANHLKEIAIEEKDMVMLNEECQQLINIKRRYKAPIIPRVCILGPRGSGRKTQGKLLAKKFNLVYIDFEYILLQEWLSRTHLGLLLKATRDKLGEYSVLLTAVVHKRILKKDCIERGWVLVGFPNTLDNIKHMDMIDTPPNRIIFLEGDLSECKKRVLDRRYNMHTGTENNLNELPLNAIYPHLQHHPKDKEEYVNNEINYYCEHYNGMRRYCGGTANIVRADQPVQWVFECICSVVMRPMPACEPRCPHEEDVRTISEQDISLPCICPEE